MEHGMVGKAAVPKEFFRPSEFSADISGPVGIGAYGYELTALFPVALQYIRAGMKLLQAITNPSCVYFYANPVFQQKVKHPVK